MPDIRQGRAVQASEGCQRCVRREEDQQERAEPLTASAPEILFPSRPMSSVLSIYWRWL